MNRIEEFRRELEASRVAIRGDYSALRRELDFVGKARRSVASKPLPWLGGAAAIGWLFAGRRKARKARRQKTAGAEAVESAKQVTILGVLIAALRMLFPVVQPLLTAYASRKVGEFAARRF
jgi:hypothetical protein